MKKHTIVTAVVLLSILLTCFSKFTEGFSHNKEYSGAGNLNEISGNVEIIAFQVETNGSSVRFDPGKPASFSDGSKIGLVHQTNGFDYSKDEFTYEMESQATGKVSHSFKIEFFPGSGGWLIVDPTTLYFETPIVTHLFLQKICQLPKGNIDLTIRLLVNKIVHSEGKITYKSDGVHAKYKKVLAKFGNLAAEMAEVEKNRRIEEEKLEKEEAEKDRKREAANYYNVNIKSANPSQTLYIVQIHKGNLKKEIIELRPNATKTLQLWRGSQYEIKVYSQNQSQDAARSVAVVDQSANNKTFSVK